MLPVRKARAHGQELPRQEAETTMGIKQPIRKEGG